MFLLVVAFALVAQALGCNQRVTNDGIICVCNSSSCDTVPVLGDITKASLKVYYTSATEPGFNVKDAAFGQAKDEKAHVVSVTQDRFQTILGFGGAFTDSAGINVEKLSNATRQKLLESYFGDDGIEYNICRVPLGACDFSPRPYTLDDSDDADPDLLKFALQEEDLKYKIPMILQSLSIRGKKQLNMFASSWTSPLWMKDKKVWHGGSTVKPEHYQTWANYHLKFFDAYLEKGIKFWGLTVANEPLTGFFSGTAIPSIGWDYRSYSRYLVNHLGPSLKNSTNYADLKIMIHDESMNILPFLVPPLLDDPAALQYVDGVAMHWYQDGALDPEVRLLAQTDKKDIFVLETEACHYITKPILGSWPRAAEYLDDIITDLQYGYGGWVEWNLALDSDGGPSHINVPADAPIVISQDFTEFYKQPTFYAVGHFSKFIVPGSVRLGTTPDSAGVRTVAFLRPDGLKVVVVYNSGTANATVQIEDSSAYSSPLVLSPQSVNTVLYSSS